MSKIIQLHNCPAWCRKRGIEPYSYQQCSHIQFKGIRSLLACLSEHVYIFNEIDYRENNFNHCNLYPRKDNFIEDNKNT
jgi:hypothetical protein